MQIHHHSPTQQARKVSLTTSARCLFGALLAQASHLVGVTVSLKADLTSSKRWPAKLCRSGSCLQREVRGSSETEQKMG